MFLGHISLPRGSTSIAEASWTVERSGERGATAAGNQAFSNSVSETKKRSSYFKHANTLPVRQLPFEAVDQGGNKSSCLRKDRFLFTLSADHSISCWFSAWTLCRQHRGACSSRRSRARVKVTNTPASTVASASAAPFSSLTCLCCLSAAAVGAKHESRAERAG